MWIFVGTLLSFEGAGLEPTFTAVDGRHRSGIHFLRTAPPGGSTRWVRMDRRPYLENCTVDASIFVAN